MATATGMSLRAMVAAMEGAAWRIRPGEDSTRLRVDGVWVVIRWDEGERMRLAAAVGRWCGLEDLARRVREVSGS